MTGRTYVDNKGRLVMVTGRGGYAGPVLFFAVAVNPETGYQRSLGLPWRETFSEAQKDLDEYAAMRGWRVMT